MHNFLHLGSDLGTRIAHLKSNIKCVSACIALAFICALAACSQPAEVADDAKKGGKYRSFFIPGSNEGNGPRDIQLYIEIEKEYLQSDFTWPYENPKWAISFNIDVKDMNAPPKSGSFDYNDFDELVRVSLHVNPKDLLRRHADPKYEKYSPTIFMGEQPVTAQIYGLDVRQNLWIDLLNGPINEFYTYAEAGVPLVTIFCKEELIGVPRPRSCAMEFFVDGLSGDGLSDDFGVNVQVSMSYEQIPDWRKVWRSVNDFIQERSRIVPYQERTVWSLKNE